MRALTDNSTEINTLTETSSDIETRVNYHRKALGDLGLGLGLVGVTVLMLQTSLEALDTNIEGQLETLNETVSGNNTAISTLDTRVGGNTSSFLNISGTGGPIQTLYTIAGENTTSILNLSGTGGPIQTLEIQVDAMGDDIKTRFTYHRKALNDLGLGLGLVGATVQTLQTGLDALDTNIEGQLQTLNETVNGNSTAIDTLDTNIEGQFQTLNEIVRGKSTAISILATSSSDIETRVNYHRKVLGDLGLWLGLVGVTVETLQTSLDAIAAILLPDLTGYALETYVDGAIAAISLPNLTGYAL